MNEADALDRLDGATAIVLVARRAGEDERVEDDVAGTDAVSLSEELP